MEVAHMASEAAAQHQRERDVAAPSSDFHLCFCCTSTEHCRTNCAHNASPRLSSERAEELAEGQLVSAVAALNEGRRH